MKYTKILPVLLAAGALTVAGCGDDSSSDTAASAAGNAVDRAFIADMVPHHESAVTMAKIAQERSESAFVKQLAEDIVRTQNQEIALMRREDQTLAEAGIEKGSLGVAEHMMGMDADVDSLKTAKPFDKAFITEMIPHHEGAVTMANAELSKGKSTKLKLLAQDIITAQEREIAAMRKHMGAPAAEKSDETGAHGGGHSG
jgi:uncharacterized protein (DUF305 family)